MCERWSKTRHIAEQNKNESSEGANVINNHQGGGGNGNNPTTTNRTEPKVGGNVAAGASTITIYSEDGKTPGQFMNKINTESQAGANIAPNGRSDIETGALSNTTAEEYGKIPGTRKFFAYSKHSLIPEQYLFWIDHGEIVSG